MTYTVATGNAVTKDKTFILIFASYFNCPFGLHMKFGLQFAFEDCPTGYSVAFCPCRAFLYNLTDPASGLWHKRWHYKRTFALKVKKLNPQSIWANFRQQNEILSCHPVGQISHTTVLSRAFQG